MRSRRVVATILLATVVASSCSDDSDGSAGAGSAPESTTSVASAGNDAGTTVAPDVEVTFDVRPSSEQVTVTGASPGATLTLTTPTGESIAEGEADGAGNLVWRDVAPGTYQVNQITDEGTAASDPFEVAALDDHPDADFYASQEIGPGFGYVETRDGTLLSINVTLPGPVEDGPYPTVIEYSGYDPSNPNEPEPSMGVAAQIGFATVGVNMRGTGCSGGSFDYFEPVQSLDGYDALEAIAAQPWVAGHKVGMVGVSYPGISQLFVAATQPPSLAAITPLSVIEDVYRSVLYPGGIYNDGFAQSWAESRQADNQQGGQEWVAELIAGGDEVCEANQLLRSQNVDLVGSARSEPFYVPERYDRLAPRTFVDRIEVPVLLAGAWQDEQTGGRFATMLDDFTAAPVFKAILYNGAHADSLSPEILIRWYEFLNLYVADRSPPPLNPLLRAGAPLLYQGVYGAEGLVIPPDRFTGSETLDEARATFEADPNITVLLEMGASPASPGGPLPRGRFGLDAWPPPGAEVQTWYLADGELSDQPIGPGGAAVFRVDEENAHQVQSFAEGDPNPYDDLSWPATEPDTYLAYETADLDSDRVLAGSGSLSMSVESAGDADIEVTVSEIRPDGTEVYVQSGWLRVSHSAEDPDVSTGLAPFHTHLEADAATPGAGEATAVNVEIFPVVHVFRAGSRLRITIDTPGGSRNLWTFDTVNRPGDTIGIHVDGAELRLPFLSGVTVPAGLPACPGLRSQPCRPAPPITNRAPS